MAVAYWTFIHGTIYDMPAIATLRHWDVECKVVCTLLCRLLDDIPVLILGKVLLKVNMCCRPTIKIISNIFTAMHA